MAGQQLTVQSCPFAGLSASYLIVLSRRASVAQKAIWETKAAGIDYRAKSAEGEVVCPGFSTAILLGAPFACGLV
jgi:hypothetical protein